MYLWIGWVGTARPPQTLTLLKTKIVRFSIPCLKDGQLEKCVCVGGGGWEKYKKKKKKFMQAKMSENKNSCKPELKKKILAEGNLPFKIKCEGITVEPLFSSHPRGKRKWPLKVISVQKNVKWNHGISWGWQQTCVLNDFSVTTFYFSLLFVKRWIFSWKTSDFTFLLGAK